MLVRGSPRVRGDTGAALYFFLSSGICSFPRLLVGGLRLQDGRQRLRKGTTDVRLEDDFKVFNPLKLAKLRNRPIGSGGSRTKKLKAD